MFDFADKPLVWIPVRWRGLKANGDNVAESSEHEIEMLVEIVDRATLRELFPTKGDESPEDVEVDLDDKELKILQAIAHDWRGVRDGNSPVPFNEENIRRMLKVPMFGNGFEKCYIDAWTGRVELREKNSASSPSGGRADAARGAKATKAKAKPNS